jgi:hypothetical protein
MKNINNNNNHNNNPFNGNDKHVSDLNSPAYIELPRDEVGRRALQLWRMEGRPAGRDLEFWLQAEVQLLSERRSYRGESPSRSPVRSCCAGPRGLRSRRQNWLEL